MHLFAKISFLLHQHPFYAYTILVEILKLLQQNSLPIYHPDNKMITRRLYRQWNRNASENQSHHLESDTRKLHIMR